MAEDYCLFCDRDNQEEHRLIIENELFYSRWDNFPVSNGHAQVVPKQHIVSLFELTDQEILQMHNLIKKTREIIQEKYNPDGYNVGCNEGLAAGRTVQHLHMHIIPRYKGDIENPRGGIRNVIPGKAIY